MAGREKIMQEIVEGLEGLLTLNEWERTLLQDLQTKAQNGVRLGPDPAGPPPADKNDRKNP